MPAAALGKFFLSMSLQISQIFVIMLCVAVTSLIYASSPQSTSLTTNQRQKVFCRRPALSHGRLLLTRSSLTLKQTGCGGNQFAPVAAASLEWSPRRTPQIRMQPVQIY
jgi:hypothetical protein